MQEKHLFEYAVVRVVPHVEREEFLNIGVILLCTPQKFLDVRFKLDESRLRHFCKHIDLDELKDYLTSFEAICHGDKHAGPIAQLSLAERFRWLTSARSTILQPSHVHPGLSINAEETLGKLFSQLVETD